MLLTSVILVLREVLEASLLLSILLAISRFVQMRVRWFWASLAVGVIGSVIFGNQLGWISDRFDGMGQELFDAGLQIVIYFLLLIISVLFITSYHRAERPGPDSIAQYQLPLSQYSMLLAVSLAVLREGSEIYIYLSAFRGQPEMLSSVLTGALLGAGIGFSFGALFYYLLLSLPRRYTLFVVCTLLTLVAGGMCLQAAQLLVQADWLPAQSPLWNSSGLLPEESLPGQLLYALLGYEASPTPVEVIIYCFSVTLMALLLGFTHYVYRNPEPCAAHRSGAPTL